MLNVNQSLLQPQVEGVERRLNLWGFLERDLTSSADDTDVNPMDNQLLKKPLSTEQLFVNLLRLSKLWKTDLIYIVYAKHLDTATQATWCTHRDTTTLTQQRGLVIQPRDV